MQDLLEGLGSIPYLPLIGGGCVAVLLIILIRPRLRLPVWRVPRFVGQILGPRFVHSQALREAAARRRQNDFIGAAKALESAGLLADAAECYLQGGDFFHAAVIRERQGSREAAAELYRRAGDFRRAGDLFAAAGRADRAAELYQERGNELEAARFYSQDGQEAKAAELFLRAGYHLRAAEAFQRAGRYKDAAESYERDFWQKLGSAVDTSMMPPNDRRSAYLAGRLYEQGGLASKAQHIYARGGYMREAGAVAVQLQDSNKASEYYLAAGDPLAAAEAHERAGDVAAGARLRAEAALAGDRVAEAASYFQKSGEFRRAAQLFESLGMSDRAAAALEDAGDFAAAGAAYLRAGLDRHAARAYERAGEKSKAAKIHPTAGSAGPRTMPVDVMPRFAPKTEVGRGPLGVVFQADDRDTGELVALRVLPRELLEDPALRKEVADEATRASELRHPNLVRVLGFVEIDDRACVVSEYVTDARTFAGPLGAGQKMPYKKALKVAKALVPALAYLHERGVVHGSIQPSNMMMMGGVIKLADIGLCRLSVRAAAGDPRYQAPERLFDAAADVYSLGAVLYHLVCGVDPKSQPQGVALPLPSRFNPKIPESFDRVLIRALHPDRTLRYASGTEMSEALK